MQSLAGAAHGVGGTVPGHIYIEQLRQRLEVEDLERRALYEILSRRCSGEFVGAEEMDERLSRMLADKRRVHGVSA